MVLLTKGQAAASLHAVLEGFADSDGRLRAVTTGDIMTEFRRELENRFYEERPTVEEELREGRY